MLGALVHPATYATIIVLAPSACLSYLPAGMEDNERKDALGFLASIAAVGAPGFVIGLSNRARWE